MSAAPPSMTQSMPFTRSGGTHPDMCIESLPRRPYVVTFDDALAALDLGPAANGQGAVLNSWTDPIGAHDKKVLEVEQAMLKEKDLVSGKMVFLEYFILKFLSRLQQYVPKHAHPLDTSSHPSEPSQRMVCKQLG